jgi:hypothetical protein
VPVPLPFSVSCSSFHRWLYWLSGSGPLQAGGRIHRSTDRRSRRVLRIQGRNFGRERGEARVEFDRRVPTVSSYVSWSDELVEVRVPLYADSSLVRVVTEKGASNSRLFMSRALLPVRARNRGFCSHCALGQCLVCGVRNLLDPCFPSGGSISGPTAIHPRCSFPGQGRLPS